MLKGSQPSLPFSNYSAPTLSMSRCYQYCVFAVARRTLMLNMCGTGSQAAPCAFLMTRVAKRFSEIPFSSSWLLSVAVKVE